MYYNNGRTCYTSHYKHDKTIIHQISNSDGKMEPENSTCASREYNL